MTHVIFFDTEGAGLIALKRFKRQAKKDGFISVHDAEKIVGITCERPDKYDISFGWSYKALKEEATVESAKKLTELFKWALYLPETKERKKQ